MNFIMKSFPRQFFFILFFSILTGFSGCSAGEPENNGNLKNMSNHNDRVEGEYLVKLSQNSDVNIINKLFKAYGIENIAPAGDRLFKMKLKNDPGPEMIKEIAERSEKIEYAEPNYIYRINPPGKGGKLRDLKK